jgi:hypothetical protein
LTNGELVEENDLGSIAKVAADTFPILSGMSIKCIVLNPGALRIRTGIRYTQRWATCTRVLDPDGALDTYYLKEGVIYFVPRAYPHHIEVVDAPDIHFAIVFDQPMPGDIGYRASASAYSREVACGDVQHAYRRSARIPIHQDRSADRDPQQPRRRMGER